MTKAGAEGERTPYPSILDEFFGHHMCLGQALVLSDHQDATTFIGHTHHLFTFLHADGHGFLAQHILACTQGSQCDRGMGMIGHTYAHGFYLAIGQQFFQCAVALCIILLCQLGCTFQVHIKEAHYACFRVGCILGDMTHLGNLSTSYDSYSFHK